MSSIAANASETREDAFLGGEVKVLQPVQGYRSGIDTLILAAAVPAKPSDTVLELGCGVGVASFCLAARVAGLAMYGVELQPAYAALCRDNAKRAGLSFNVFEGDVADMPAALKALRFDQVFANPPYYRSPEGASSNDEGKDRAFREEAPLGIWIDAALRRLKDFGTLTMIHRIERLPEMLAALEGRAGDIRVKPLVARTGRSATRFVLKAQKGSATPFTLCAPLVFHSGERHENDQPDYSPEVQNLLENRATLRF